MGASGKKADSLSPKKEIPMKPLREKGSAEQTVISFECLRGIQGDIFQLCYHWLRRTVGRENGTDDRLSANTLLRLANKRGAGRDPTQQHSAGG